MDKRPFFASQAYRQSRPILLTTFTNRIGSIGLGLMPILLVSRGVSTAQGALVLAALKGTILLGTLGGGALSDRFSSRTLVLAALLFSTVGLGGLPFPPWLWLILLLGILAQFGDTLIMVSQRMLLLDQVAPEHHKEALGWLRTVNNFAQIFAYGLASFGASLGLMPLMLFDSATSFLAFLVGRNILPRASGSSVYGPRIGGGEGAPSSKKAFFGCAVVLMGWSFFYELFMEGGAGRLEFLHPGQGLGRFSSMMILNVVLCAFLSIKATRLLRSSLTGMAGGLMLTALGLLVAGWGMASQAWVFAGMFFLTLGELMLGAVAQYTLMRLTPGKGNAGFYYSLGLALMQGGKLLGAGLSFPVFIHAQSLVPFTAMIIGVLVALLAVLFSQRREIARLVPVSTHSKMLPK